MPLSSRVRHKDINLYQRIYQIIDRARGNIARAVNAQMVQAYWLIGKEIVQQEQQGKQRADYGRRIIEGLSTRLTRRYGNGWSTSHLWHVRQFYLMYQTYGPSQPILRTVCAESRRKVRDGLRHELSWSHYRVLMRIEDPKARGFYEDECARNRWSIRELERQKGSLFFERLSLGEGKRDLKHLARKGQDIQNYQALIKDPYVLEFTGLSASPKLYESALEQSLVDNLSRFLLELGKGFTFVGRQKRISLDGDHFYVDLVFYHMVLRCFVLIDLKIGKLTHQDLGQMQMYVNYYDREIRQSDDNPTVGLILCEDKKEAVVRYTLPRENRQIFASRYKLYLPTEKELKREMVRERNALCI